MSIQRQYFVDLFLAKGAVGPLPHNTGAPSGALPMPKVFGAEEVSPDYLEALLTYEDRWFRHPLALLCAAWQNLFTSLRIEPSP